MEYKDTPTSMTEPDKPVTRHRPKGRGINPAMDFIENDSEEFGQALAGGRAYRSSVNVK